jgi:hypothetical protein
MEQQHPVASHGDLFGILATFCVNIRIILNKMNIGYRIYNIKGGDQKIRESGLNIEYRSIIRALAVLWL